MVICLKLSLNRFEIRSIEVDFRYQNVDAKELTQKAFDFYCKKFAIKILINCFNLHSVNEISRVYRESGFPFCFSVHSLHVPAGDDQ